MTHDHAEDFALCDAALRLTEDDNGRLGSVGLIGSSAKWARFRHNLAAEGHDPAAIERITSPIGLPGHHRQGPGRDRRRGRCRPGPSHAPTPSPIARTPAQEPAQ